MKHLESMHCSSVWIQASAKCINANLTIMRVSDIVKLIKTETIIYPPLIFSVYRTYVTGAYMSTCRYINTCQMNVDLYVLRYECIQMYNV